MKIDQLIELARETDKNLNFQFTNAHGKIVKGYVIIAHFVIFSIDGANGFITVDQLKKVTGDVFDFEIINPEE